MRELGKGVRQLNRVLAAQGAVRPQTHALAPARRFFAVLLIDVAATVVGDLSMDVRGFGVGVSLYAGALVACLTYALRARSPSERNVALALMIVPLTRLTRLAAAVPDASPLTWYVLGGIGLGTSVVAIGRATGQSIPQLWRLPRPFPAAVAMVSGILVGAVMAAVQPLPMQRSGDPLDNVLTIMVLIIFVAFAEQHLIRGMLQRPIAAALPRWLGALVVVGLATLIYAPLGGVALAVIAVWQVVLTWSFATSPSVIPSFVGHSLALVMMVMLV
jgi:membrane protease YdiL (CAAX protease family)